MKTAVGLLQVIVGLLQASRKNGALKMNEKR